MPAEIIDRLTIEAWKESGQLAVLERAREKVQDTLNQENPSHLTGEAGENLQNILKDACKKRNLEFTQLPGIG